MMSEPLSLCNGMVEEDTQGGIHVVSITVGKGEREREREREVVVVVVVVKESLKLLITLTKKNEKKDGKNFQDSRKFTKRF